MADEGILTEIGV